MSTIKVTPEQLHHVSNQVDQARQQLESIRSDLTRQIMFVQMMWMGATQERFYYEFEQSRPILDKALESMVNTSKELKDIATRFQDADAQKGSLGGAFGAVGAAAMMTKSAGGSSLGDKGYRMAQINMFGKWVWMPVNENGVADQAALQAYQRDQGNLDFNRMQAVNVEPPGEDIFALQIKAFEMGIHPTTGEPVSDKYAQMMVTSLKFSQIFMAIQMVRGSMPGSKGPHRLPASNPAVAKIKQHIEAAKAKEKGNSKFLDGSVKGLSLSPKALEHSSKGDFTINPKNGKVSKMKGGGHGQSNIDFLKANGFEYNIEKTYSNGVRVGNIPEHKTPAKREGSNQAWFPKSWSDSDITKAGESVVNKPQNASKPDGVVVYGEYNGVRVGVIKTNGEIGTIFPDATQQP
ncbi:WXG100 family type VII secretion target [Paenibacillus sp. FSL H8-0079]|uniref:WXG100 family type VII secretion target n=1 Tax=Paenibacillus sp. FSL H8-0079 TaxID=2921375 RepID=UPI0030EF45D3